MSEDMLRVIMRRHDGGESSQYVAFDLDLADVQAVSSGYVPRALKAAAERAMTELLGCAPFPVLLAGDVFTFQYEDTGLAYTYVVESVAPWRTSGRKSLDLSWVERGWHDHRTAWMLRQGKATSAGARCVLGPTCDQHND